MRTERKTRRRIRSGFVVGRRIGDLAQTLDLRIAREVQRQRVAQAQLDRVRRERVTEGGLSA